MAAYERCPRPSAWAVAERKAASSTAGTPDPTSALRKPKHRPQIDCPAAVARIRQHSALSLASPSRLPCFIAVMASKAAGVRAPHPAGQGQLPVRHHVGGKQVGTGPALAVLEFQALCLECTALPADSTFRASFMRPCVLCHLAELNLAVLAAPSSSAMRQTRINNLHGARDHRAPCGGAASKQQAASIKHQPSRRTSAATVPRPIEPRVKLMTLAGEGSEVREENDHFDPPR